MVKSLSTYICIIIASSGFCAQVNPWVIKLEEARVLMNEGHYAEAERLTLVVLNSDDSEIDQLTVGHANQLMGLLCAVHARKSEQIEYYFKSYRIFHEGGNLKEEAEALRLIGHYYLGMKLLKEAQEYLTQAETLAIQQGDITTRIKVISNKAQLAAASDSLEKAIKLYKEAIALSDSVSFSQGLRENWNRLSYAYLRMNKASEMLTCMKNALKCATSNADTLAVLFADIGLAYQENNKLDSADYYIQKGLEQIKKGENLEQQMIILNQLSSLRQKQGRTGESLALLQESVQLRDQLYTRQLQEDISEIGARYKELSVTNELIRERSNKQLILIWLVVGIIFLFISAVAILWLRHNHRRVTRQKSKLDIALNQLQKSEELYKQLFESNSGLVITHTLEGMVTSANHAVLEFFQVKKTEIIGRSVKDFIHSSHSHLFADYLQEINEKKKSTGLLSVVNSEGNKKILRYQNNIVIDQQGKPFVIGFSQDQTEFFKAQHTAEQTRKRLSLIMENAPDMYAILKKDGLIIYTNRSNFLKPGEEMVGRNVSEFLNQDQANHFYEQFKLVFDKSEIVQYEVEFNEKYFITKLIPIIENGFVKEVLSVSSDVSILKKNEFELRKLSSIVEQTINGVVITDVLGRVIWANASFNKITGYGEEEITGKKPGQFLQGPETDSETVAYMRFCIQNRGPIDCEILNYNKRGGTYWVKITAQPIVDANGKFQGYFSIQQDISREKKLLQQLTVAKEEAEESNRLKTIFLGSLSHEVRTPLQGILGFAEILENTDITEHKRKQYLQIIKKRAADLQQIIDSLLDMASLETGEIKSYPVSTNLSELVKNVFDSLVQDSEFNKKRVELKIENYLPLDVVVEIDPLHVRQVLVNLIGNAVKFTEEGSVILRCEYKNSLRFMVIDNGIGMAPGTLDQIFKPFRQAHEGLSRAKGGIGLGLAICKKMVEMWGGEISVESEPDKGSVFSFTIPRQPSKIFELH